jgi:hypothetical protein
MANTNSFGFGVDDQIVDARSGGGGGGSQRSQTVSEGGGFFSDPDFVKQLSQMFGGVTGGASSDYLDFVKNPTASPYFQNAYTGLLDALQPYEEASRLALGDEFRGAGNMSSTMFRDAGVNLEGELGRNRNQTLSQLLTTMFPQVTQALYNPIDDIASMIQALTLQQQKSSTQSMGATAGAAPEQKLQYTGSSGVGGPAGIGWY